MSTGLVAVLCKCIFPSQSPCQWTSENKSSRFSPWPPPLPLSVLASQLSSHRACSPRAPLLLGEFRKQGRGVEPILNTHFCFFLKYVQSLLKWDPPPPFPMWQCFLQIVDIPSKTFVEKTKQNMQQMCLLYQRACCIAYHVPVLWGGVLWCRWWQGTHRKVS